MAELGNANIGGRMVPAWLLNLTAEELDGLKEYSKRYSNPNLLDNPWFTVNQRGATSYVSNNSYGVDRWKCSYADTISINSNNEITLNGTLAGHTATLEQPVDRSLLNLIGKQVTFSFLTTSGDVKSVSFTVRDSIENYYCVDNENKEYVCIDTRGNREVCYIQIINEVVTIKAVKLELGNVSTLANDIPPNYAQELAKCRRYFYRIESDGEQRPITDVWTYENGTSKLGTIILPVDMARAPTISYSALSDLLVLIGGRNQGNISYFGYSSAGYPNRCVLQFNTSTAANEGLSGTAYVTNHGHVDFSADL